MTTEMIPHALAPAAASKSACVIPKSWLIPWSRDSRTGCTEPGRGCWLQVVPLSNAERLQHQEQGLQALAFCSDYWHAGQPGGRYALQVAHSTLQVAHDALHAAHDALQVGHGLMCKGLCRLPAEAAHSGLHPRSLAAFVKPAGLAEQHNSG